MKFKPFTQYGFTDSYWIKRFKNAHWGIVTGKYWDGAKWIIFASDYAGKGQGDATSLKIASTLDYTVSNINFSDLELADESLVASANINAIVRGDFNSLDLVNPKEVNLTTITFQLYPDYWIIYNYQASDFELVGATGNTLAATGISYDVNTKTFTLTFPSIEHINPAPDLKTRLFMRSGAITNVFGTVLDESHVTFETTYEAVPPAPGTIAHDNSLEVIANLEYITQSVIYSEQDLDDESLTATATIGVQVKDINDNIIIEF